MASVVYAVIGAVGIVLGTRVIMRVRPAASGWNVLGGIVLILLGLSFVIGGLWLAGQLTGTGSGS